MDIIVSGQKNKKGNGVSKSKQGKRANVNQSPLVAELFEVLQRHLNNQQPCDDCGNNGSLAFNMITELCALQDDAPVIVVGVMMGEYAKEGGLMVGNRPMGYRHLCGDCIRELIDDVRTQRYVGLMLDPH